MKTDEADFYVLDEHRLDEEWVNQPKLYFEYASKLVEARTEFERAKADKDLVWAEVDLAVRANPEKYKLAKTTESTISSAITLDRCYQKANDNVLDAKHHMDSCQVAVDTLDHRKKALENMVHLHAMNYHSTPQAPQIAKDRLKDVERSSVFRAKGKKNDQ